LIARGDLDARKQALEPRVVPEMTVPDDPHFPASSQRATSLMEHLPGRVITPRLACMERWIDHHHIE
jgi:hypothetical protein